MKDFQVTSRIKTTDTVSANGALDTVRSAFDKSNEVRIKKVRNIKLATEAPRQIRARTLVRAHNESDALSVVWHLVHSSHEARCGLIASTTPVTVKPAAATTKR